MTEVPHRIKTSPSKPTDWFLYNSVLGLTYGSQVPGRRWRVSGEGSRVPGPTYGSWVLSPESQVPLSQYADSMCTFLC